MRFPCQVTAIHGSGVRHTATIIAKSVNWAAIRYLSGSVANFPGPSSFPKTDDATFFEVVSPKETVRISKEKLLTWANREAEMKTQTSRDRQAGRSRIEHDQKSN